MWPLLSLALSSIIVVLYLLYREKVKQYNTLETQFELAKQEFLDRRLTLAGELLSKEQYIQRLEEEFAKVADISELANYLNGLHKDTNN